MLNIGKFAKKTVIITGASRGIGREIALKLAKDGANIVIAAKTATPHSKLAGTIYSVAEEIEKIGGKALPCVVDVRDEQSIENCIAETIKKFNGIDVLINNASAISLTGTLETNAKKYDLMHQVNVRGTYLMSQKCIPHLKKSSNPHILNISPPLVMDKKWFQNHVAYTMTKYGMSMCVLGMHEEFRDYNIAVNALWPKTAIWTAAMEMISSGEGEEGSRKPSILADAAYAVLSKNSSEFTGNFVIDENILRNEGITNFEEYECKPGAPLTPDFFIPEEDLKSFARESKSVTNIQNLSDAIKFFNKILTPSMCEKVNNVYQFVIKKEDKTKSYILLDFVNKTVEEKKIDDAPCTIIFNETLFFNIINGKASIQDAIFSGKMNVKGNLILANKLKNIFKSSKSKL
ncbi:Hydroxysteroid dehydrogenase-like protein 2 [Strongyloides ratti]|uniref:Hydroxysteroid dehydrogenase-like protein 2 n=1 Tax=Strongyloides ratti TaxID=34506 RepID=A0A090KYF0_STRRB|nr:Hydroxysteroid dehydrogenase-like protein 2 [Strongyloides ratti]CEF60203.1 Hydroxysteroid dehydrogenase-like protein 2 [Strongyloides ratti]